MKILARSAAAVCDIGNRMWQRELVAGFDGNISVRLGSRHILCTPTGVSKGFMSPNMLCLIDLQGKPLNLKSPGRPTSEILLHLQIYHRRPDVRAVVHAHPPHATAFACSGIPLPEGLYPEADAMLGRVVEVPYTTPGYRALGASVAAAIGEETNSVLMANHGSVHFGRSLEEAYCYLEVLDAYCRILLMLKQLGQVSPPTRKQLQELLEEKTRRGMKDARAGDADRIGKHNGRYLRGLQLNMKRL